MAEVCVDANYALKLVLAEPESPKVRAQWVQWNDAGMTVVAPALWAFESHSVLRRKWFTGAITEAEARDGWQALLHQGITVVDPPGLFDRALALSIELSRPTTYDMTYMAVADLLGCDLWTADQRVINAAGGRFPWLHSVHEL